MTALAPPPAAPPGALGAIQRAAKAQGLDWRPLAAVAHYESGLNPRALGDGGHAFGLFQNNNAGGTITGDPNPRRFFDPNVAAGYAAKAVAKLGLRGMSPQAQIDAIVRRYERPAAPDPEVQGALSYFNQNYRTSNPLAQATTARPLGPTQAASAAPRAPTQAAAASPAPDYTFLQQGLVAAQGATQRALSGLSAISGTAAPVAPTLDLSSIINAATPPSALTRANVPSDKVVPLRGVSAGKTTPTGLDTQGKKAVALAKQFLGTPYLYGGANPKTGFDCSGLLAYVWGKNGVQIPHNAQAQYDAATKVDAKHLAPGDAVFFRDRSGIHHVGMYIGGANRQFIQAPHTGDHVKISSLNESYYASQFAGGGRFA